MLDKFLKSIQRMNPIQRLLFYQFLFFHLPLCQHSQIMIKVYICNKILSEVRSDIIHISYISDKYQLMDDS